ncbi:MAG: immunoglobulin domain-containing protein [Verrucomicrobia bacterium]|nr:immunoglobulin domain-containing protein [Verrucomicrobiota bacterium]
MLIMVLASAFISTAAFGQAHSDLADVPAGTRKLIILVHGWNSGDVDDMYAEGNWPALVSQLSSQADAQGWELLLYDWHDIASTGGVLGWDWQYGPVVAYQNGVEAAIEALLLGDDLGVALSEFGGAEPSLREVHFIAHSAGSWCARRAMSVMMQRHPYVVTQLTLLDPFVPDASLLYPYNTGLDNDYMESLATGPYQDRIYRIENYYATVNDITLSTQEEFSWRSGDINQDVSYFGQTIGYQYTGHGGPIGFYAESVQATDGPPVPSGQAQAPWEFTQIGFYRSLLYEWFLRPRITQQPVGVTASEGSEVTLSLAAQSSQGVSYSWYYEDGAFPVATGASYSFNINSGNAGRYVALAYNANGLIYSDVVVASIEEPDAPSISGVTPRTLLTSASRQLITITGSGFSASTTLRFHWDGETYYSQPEHFTYVNSGEVRYNVAVGTDGVGAWTVVAIDGGQESAPYAFTVVAAQATPLSLGIEGAASMFENDSENYVARVYYSDGTSSLVTPTWSEDSSATTISSGGQLSAGSVSSDTLVTITASFTANGVTVTDDHEVMVLNSGTGGGDTVELIENGDFADDDDHWTTSGNFYADDRFSNSHSDPGYAYLSLSDGSPGNNLNGEIVQYIDVPDGATDVSLEYWYHITTQESGGTAYDYLGVNVIRDGGGVVESETLSNLDANSGYQRRTINLSGVAGDRLLIGFGGSTDGSLPTVFRIDDVSVEATVPPALVNLAIEGPSSVLEEQSAQYTAVASFADGSEEVVDADDWDEDSSYASITSNGRLDTEEVTRDRSVGIDAEYTFNGVRKTAFKRVTIVNVRPAFTGVSISGPTVVNERSVIQYEAQALYSDGTSDDIDPLWTVNSPFASISVGGSLGIGEVRSNSTVTITASFTEEGVTQVGTLVVSVNDISNPRLPVSLAITGPAEVPEGRFGEYVATVYYDDGSSIAVDPDWTDNSALASVSAAGTLSVGSVLLDTDITIGATYTEQGITVSDNKTVTIVNDTTARLSADQLGLTHQITEGDSVSNDVLRISNRGDGTVDFTVGLSGAVGWVSVAPSSGSVSNNEVNVTVMYSTEALPVGIHSVDLRITPTTVAGEATAIPITVIVEPDSTGQPYVALSARRTDVPRVSAAATAPDGGSLLVGHFWEPTSVAGSNLTAVGSLGESDVFAVRFDAAGNLMWLQQYGGEFEEEVDDCIPHPAGGWLMCGHFRETGVFGAHSVVAAGTDDKRDAYLARLDDSGNVLWVRRAGGAETDYGEAIATDSAGNCILFGEFTENCTFDGGGTTLTAVGTRFDVFVVKYSATGGFIWAKGAGGDDYDTASCVGVDGTDAIYFAGNFTDTATFGGTSLSVEGTRSRDAYIAKLSSSGNFQWARRFGEPAGESSSEDVDFLTPSSQGGMFFGGYFDGPWTIPDATLPDAEGAFAGRIEADGDVAWIDNVYADHWAENAEFDYGMEMADGGLLAAGSYRGWFEFGSTIIEHDEDDLEEHEMIAKFAPNGAPEWAIAITSSNNTSVLSLDAGTGNKVRAWFWAETTVNLPGYGSFALNGSDWIVVEFGPPSAEIRPVLDNMRMVEGMVRARFFGIPGETYTLQRCHNLLDNDWDTIQTGVFSDLGWILFEDADSLGTTNCFYRVLTSP